MKKLILPIATLFLVLSCEKEVIEPVVQGDPFADCNCGIVIKVEPFKDAVIQNNCTFEQKLVPRSEHKDYYITKGDTVCLDSMW